MSQKRDDRFASAVLMREAVRVASVSTREFGDAETVLAPGAGGYSGASTVASGKATRLMGEQTQAAGNEARTLLAADATKVRGTSMSEVATVVRSANARGSRVWLAAALLIVLIAGGAGGFYVYRARRQAQQAAAPSQTPTQPAEPSQSPIISASVPVEPTKTNESKAEKKAENSQRAVTSRQPADKTAASKSNNSGPGDLPAPGHRSDRNPDRRGDPNVGPSPQSQPPPFDPLRNPQGRQPGHPSVPREMPTVRTLPNGTRVVIQPDGTRVMTWPNGRVQVIPPGEKPIRRRGRP